jgi:hypothetical protein
MMKKLLFLMVLACFVTSAGAQEVGLDDTVPTNVSELNAFLSSLGPVNANAKSALSRQHVENLLYKLQPSIYFEGGTAKTYGKRPNNLFTDMASLPVIADAPILKGGIEIVTIRISSASDLNATIDLSVFADFPKLKFVHIISSVPVTAAQLNAMVQNQEAQMHVFYHFENGDSGQ